MNSDSCKTQADIDREDRAFRREVDEYLAENDLQAVPVGAVVLDLEDRKQVDRLVDAVLAHGYRFTGTYSDMRAALRSLIAPPKPDEPGRYGVVEDAEGWEWCRIDWGSEGYTWQRLGQPSTSPPTYATWAGLAAVKVLSQGVTS